MDTQFTSIAPYYDELMAIVPYRKWVDYVLRICRKYRHRPQRVLDCACGTGNLTFELARRGLEVVGVDISNDMINEAQRKRESYKSTFEGTLPQFQRSDLCELNLKTQFDTITCLYDSLNYLTESRRLKLALERVRQHLTPGGIFIFDMNSPYAFETDMFTQSDRSPFRKLHYDWVAEYDQKTKMCKVDMTFIRYMEDGSYAQFQETHYERSYSMREVCQLLDEAGLRLLSCFDSYRLAPPHPRSERWFFAVTGNF